jgi:hypothetical protein
MEVCLICGEIYPYSQRSDHAHLGTRDLLGFHTQRQRLLTESQRQQLSFHVAQREYERLFQTRDAPTFTPDDPHWKTRAKAAQGKARPGWG